MSWEDSTPAEQMLIAKEFTVYELMARVAKLETINTDLKKQVNDSIEFCHGASMSVERSEDKVASLRGEISNLKSQLKAAQKIRNWHEAPKHDGPILAVTRIRWVDTYEMWSAVGCQGEFVHDDADGWLPDQSGKGGPNG